jgi:hypothetical protein
MSRRTKGHYPFLLKFNRSESFHNPPAHVQSLSRSVQFFFLLPPGFLMSGLKKNSLPDIEISGGSDKPTKNLGKGV